MDMASEQMLAVSKDRAWDALNDPEVLKVSIPGCDSIERVGENEYEVALTAAVGPVKARFKGKMRLADIVPPDSYAIQFEGQGGAAGHGKGSAKVRLEAAGEDETKLIYSASAQVGGKIAQIGSRLVDMAAQKMANEFFSAFNAELTRRYPKVAAPGTEPAASTAPEGSKSGLKRTLNWLKGSGKDKDAPGT
jgi:carbon monoxide dehydrogenase subunit G